MNLDLLATLMSAAVSLSGYAAPDSLPEVQYKPHEFFVENACLGKECNAVGWYNDQGIVYIDVRYEDQQADISWFGNSLVVHELVHYLQHMNGNVAVDCSVFLEREKEAVRVQRRYISEWQWRRDTIMPKETACAE